MLKLVANLFTKAFAIKEGKEMRKKRSRDEYWGVPCSLGVKKSLIEYKKADNEMRIRGVVSLIIFFIFLLTTVEVLRIGRVK